MLSFKQYVVEEWENRVKDDFTQTTVNLYKNPTKKEWSEIFAQSSVSNDARYLVFDTGDLYAWSAEGPMHVTILSGKLRNLRDKYRYWGGFAIQEGPTIKANFNNTRYLVHPKGKDRTFVVSVMNKRMPSKVKIVSGDI